MRRRGTGRGTAFHRGVISGTTIEVPASGATLARGVVTAKSLAIPAGGVTLSTSGIGYTSGTFVTLAELGKLDGIVGYSLAYPGSAGVFIKAGVSKASDIYVSSSHTLFLKHGFSTLVGLTYVMNHDGTGVSTSYISAYDATNKGVTITCIHEGTNAPTNTMRATTVQWVAFGT